MLEVVNFADVSVGDELLLIETLNGGAYMQTRGTVTHVHDKWGEIQLGGYSVEVFDIPADELVIIRLSVKED